MINPLKFIQSVKQEAFKVTWPTKRDVMVGSLMVFVLATIAAVFFLLLDQIYKTLLDLLSTNSLFFINSFIVSATLCSNPEKV